ncbi:hypothetical protein [Actinocorallia longicatena]|uniref:ABC transporter permease n=1 Tax=Actinocorallia longicatena TaxID=111803 RepID=A0ABP6QFL0_9ACTN
MKAMILKEFLELRRDKRTMVMIIALPLLLLVIFGYAASFTVDDLKTDVYGAGLPVTLAGRTVRLADTAPGLIRKALDAAGITADVRRVPATLEEKMTGIDRATRAAARVTQPIR